ncbi:hypothetical protein EDD21DRAFT_427102 [Dissophora ornata]|nr:hypothetical protein EDD21DRAFT_427102 [Dissophora ornata]
MVTFGTRVAQLWPRVFVGIWCVMDICVRIAISFQDLQVLTSRGFHLNSFLLSHKDNYKIPDSILFSFVVVPILVDLVTLYAAVYRSIPATKFSLAIFWFKVVYITLLLVMIVPTTFHGTALDDFPLAIVFASIMGDVIYGYSLVVMLRDFRGQPRNRWGCLVALGENAVFEVEVPSVTSHPIRPRQLSDTIRATKAARGLVLPNDGAGGYEARYKQ